jgi:hydrogenase maturation protease
MPDFREQLRKCCQGRVCLLGLGNVHYGDDAFGARLAEALLQLGATAPWNPDLDPAASGGRPCCLVGGTNPERLIGRVAERAFDHLVFLDAVEFGSAPGSAVLLDSSQMAARFPQVSTHKASLGLLAKWVEANGATKAWLLGVQPESLRPEAPLSAAVRQSLELLATLLGETFTEATP